MDLPVQAECHSDQHQSLVMAVEKGAYVFLNLPDDKLPSGGDILSQFSSIGLLMKPSPQGQLSARPRNVTSLLRSGAQVS